METSKLKELEELNKRIKEKQDAENKLHREAYDLDLKRMEILAEKCGEDVGRCFKGVENGKMTYAMIIGVPERESSMTSIWFNEHQRPAVFVRPDADNETMEDLVYNDHFFTGHFPETTKRPFRCEPWVEISQREFLEAYKKCLSLFTMRLVDVAARAELARASREFKPGASEVSAKDFATMCGGWLDANADIALKMNDSE